MMPAAEVTEAIATVIADEIGARLFTAGADSDLPPADTTWTYTNRPGLPPNVALIGLTDSRIVTVLVTLDDDAHATPPPTVAAVWGAGYHQGREDEALHRPVPPGIYEDEDTAAPRHLWGDNVPCDDPACRSCHPGETEVRLAEEQAQLIARAITLALDGVGSLSTVQRMEINQAVARRLEQVAPRE
jgi:hypothetical protein